MKKIITAVALALLVLTGVSAQSAYDRGKVKEAMRAMYGAVKNAQKAYDAQDDKAAVAAFQAIPAADKPLLGMNPPKGSKEDWDKNLTRLNQAAQKGADAAGKKDWPTVKAALDELRSIQGDGHREFKG